MKKALFRLGVARSVLIIAAVAAVVAFLGLRLAEGEPPPPRTGTLSTPAPTAAAKTPVAPYARPDSIGVAGTDVPLAPRMTYHESDVADPATGELRTVREIWYDPKPEVLGVSWLSLYEDGRISRSHILAEDMRVFQPLLDAALPQLPTTETIAGKEFTHAPGMGAGQLLPARNSTTRVWCIHYTSIPVKPAGSSLCVDQEWNTVSYGIDPDDLALFQPLLDSVTSQLPETVVVNGHKVWPLPGAALQRVIENCPPSSVNTNACRPITYTIRRSGFSFIIFDETEIITENLAPEDRADFQPVFDAFSASQ